MSWWGKQTPTIWSKAPHHCQSWSSCGGHNPKLLSISEVTQVFEAQYQVTKNCQHQKFAVSFHKMSQMHSVSIWTREREKLINCWMPWRCTKVQISYDSIIFQEIPRPPEKYTSGCQLQSFLEHKKNKEIGNLQNSRCLMLTVLGFTWSTFNYD